MGDAGGKKKKHRGTHPQEGHAQTARDLAAEGARYPLLDNGEGKLGLLSCDITQNHNERGGVPMVEPTDRPIDGCDTVNHRYHSHSTHVAGGAVEAKSHKDADGNYSTLVCELPN